MTVAKINTVDRSSNRDHYFRLFTLWLTRWMTSHYQQNPVDELRILTNAPSQAFVFQRFRPGTYPTSFRPHKHPDLRLVFLFMEKMANGAFCLPSSPRSRICEASYRMQSDLNWCLLTSQEVGEVWEVCRRRLRVYVREPEACWAPDAWNVWRTCPDADQIWYRFEAAEAKILEWDKDETYI